MSNIYFDQGSNRNSCSKKKSVDKILDKAISGHDVTADECIQLFETEGEAATRVFEVANFLRSQVNGNKVSFVVNRNINFTNICYMGCRFCGFAKRIEDADAEWLQIEEIVDRAKEASRRGATEVCIQGGLHPKMRGFYYRDLVRAIKTEIPNIHIHAFSPFEIWYGSSKTGLSYEEFLMCLKEAGLGSMPGTAAEILDTSVRKQLTKNKLSAAEWIKIIKTAHLLGIRSTATIMYGHVDRSEHWAKHIELIRTIQKETRGFTEFVPLSFVHSNSPLFKNNPSVVRPGPSIDEIKKMHAISRIMLNGWVNNIQVSWTKLGPKLAQEMLYLGVNDLGGTLMNESISRSAGANNGQELTPVEMSKLIRMAGKIPVRRNTLYESLEVYEVHEPNVTEPLVNREQMDPLAFLRKVSSNKREGRFVP